MKKIIFFTAALIAGSLGFSGGLSFPVNGLIAKNPQPVAVHADWEDSWLTDTNSYDYHHGIARIACMLSEISYVDVEGNPDTNEMKLSYRALGIKDSDMEFHYNLDYSSPILGDNQSAFSFATKKVSTANGKKTLIFVVIRGTPLNANEWISNLAISDSSQKDSIIHEGFYRTMVQVHNALVYFLLKHQIDPDEACFLITGHSRGAAVSNLLGAALYDGGIFDSKKIFVYTYASPNVTQSHDVTKSEYKFIWNIVNGEDIVPTVPPCRNNWKFSKYGNILVLPNRWNTETQIFDSKYIPEVNKIYNRLLHRDYFPFKNGTFIQSSVARFLTGFYKNVSEYYSGIFNLRTRGENLMWKIFPDKTMDSIETEAKDVQASENKEAENTQEKKGFFNNLITKVNTSTDGGVDYVMNAFVDMHACELYLSWMMALEKDDLFKNLGSIQLVIDGYYECAIFDKDDKMVAQVLDGVIQYTKTVVPVAAMPMLGKKTAIGFPANDDFKVVIYKPSLIPTIIHVTVEHYDVTGQLINVSQKKNLYPVRGIGISFKAGKILLEEDHITPKIIKGKELKQAVARGELEQDRILKFQPEFTLDTNKNLALGVRGGTSNLYFSVLTTQSIPYFGDRIDLAPGIGHEHALYGNIMLNTEAYGRFVFILKDIDDNRFNFVPSLRLSLAFKPVHRFQFFTAGIFDLNIKDFNDGAFNSEITKQKFNTIRMGDSLRVAPSICFGMRF